MTSPRSRPSRAIRRGARSLAGHAILLLIAVAACVEPRAALAQGQAAQSKAAGVFDEDEREKEKKASEAKPSGTTKAAAVSDRDSIGFTQENVAAQMTELEERMFRLSE